MKKTLDDLHRKEAEADGFALMASARYEAHAEAWARNPRNVDLPMDLDLMALHCWSFSPGGKADGMSDTLRAYHDAAMATAQPKDWYDTLLSARASCRTCGDSFRVENLMVCSHCLALHCHACAGRGNRARNGNWQCSCGGELIG